MIGIFCFFLGLIIWATVRGRFRQRQNMGEALVANTLGRLNGLHVLLFEVIAP